MGYRGIVVSLVVMAAVAMAMAGSCSAVTWNTSWSNKKAITFSTLGGTSDANFTLLLNVSYEAAMQPQFGDIRFTNASQDSELSYYVVANASSDYADVYVRIPQNVTASSQTIYMYYGNPDAVTASDGNKTFRLFDDAETGSVSDYWKVTGTSAYTATEKYQGAMSIGGTPNWYLSSGYVPYGSDFIFNGWFHDDSSDNSGEISIVWLDTVGGATGDDGVAFRSAASTTHYCYYVGGVYTATSIARSTAWHHVEMRHAGTSYVEIYLDGTLIANDTSGVVANQTIITTTVEGITAYFDQMWVSTWHMPGMQSSFSGEQDSIDPFPTVTITSPANSTYTKSTIPLTWDYVPSVSTGSQCSTALYSLDGESNISIGCANTTISLSSTSASERTITLYAIADDGNMSSDTVSFSLLYGDYTLRIYDEMTGDPYNTSEMSLTAYCDNQTQEITVTNHTQAVSIECQFNFMELSITNSTAGENGTETSRSLIPSGKNGTLPFYMINTTGYTKQDQTWQVYDLSGDYTSGVIQISKVVPGHGVQVLTQQVADSEDRVYVDLIPGEMYVISILDSGLGNERTIGSIDATAATSVNLEVSSVPYSTDVRTMSGDVLITFIDDKDAAKIYVTYNDTKGTTTSVNVTIVNASNVTQTMFSSGSYIVSVVSDSTAYGIRTETKVVSFSGTGDYDIPELDALGMGILKAVAGIMIVLFVLLAFGRRSAKFGLAVSVTVLAVLMYWGWFSTAPQMTWSIVTLLAIVSIASIFSLRGRYQ
jgi:hypothetical protein